MISNSYQYTTRALCTMIVCLIAPLKTSAQNAGSIFENMTPEQCSALVSNAERLACYDYRFRQHVIETPAVFFQQDESQSLERLSNTANIITQQSDQLHPFKSSKNISLLDQRWELTPETKKGVWRLSAFQPVYALPLFWTTRKNELPTSPNPRNTVPKSDQENLNSMESKFQISMKTKAIENIFGNNGDLWLGYTQSSHWQVYNSKESRPFRATNYEPEASLMFRTNYNILGLNGRLLGVGFNHQSNGSSDPFSRSWNRVMFNIGFERENFVLMIRPWFRVPETGKDDDNPNIIDYMGRGDITTFYKWKDQHFSLMLRHNLKTGSNAHGAAQFDWTFPINGNLRGYLQLFDGYGESLIDYNHRATYIGLGVSLVDWY
ncbi:phospholipase [Acinetobacter sp. ANC 4558]|uniref:phospholipase A n=1 Tax=Acinetobacter sp. ANC 4558 TaxID=1977876 RepID=UPI000A34EE42|nr:phospholipase A [Acinetobacter sp. ANC 4558]OTG87103.1 phospholipase [Acinetobacter sp. ANC 4558]